MILFHGRFQPPHMGHVQIAEYYIQALSLPLVFSLDVRSRDTENPFTYKTRARILRDLLKVDVETTWHHCKEQTIQGCLQAIYENAIITWDITDVIFGPKPYTACVEYWRSQGMHTHCYPERIQGLSGTQAREALGIGGEHNETMGGE